MLDPTSSSCMGVHGTARLNLVSLLGASYAIFLPHFTVQGG